jgi:CHAT domain-containing protein
MLTGTIAGRASSLVLTPSDRTDGYLSASEISALDLSSSYLTVLSACETAASGDVQSSLDSIAASFLSAGSPTVIGSQWAVSDESTAQLMMRFYERFLEIGPASALRKAQLGLSEQKDYRHPFFWAAFVLYGWDK